jgi:hypothetical protein
MERRPATSYPVLFREGGAPPIAGSLTVEPTALVLEGGAAAERVSLRVEFGDLREIRIARRPMERINGHRVLVLERVDGPAVHIAPMGSGLLHEIADLTAALAGLEIGTAAAANETATVVVPLRAGQQERVRELVAAGPPFDPAGLELTEHRVLLRDDEVIFVFTGRGARRKIEQASRAPSLWRAGLKWSGSIAGAPRLLAGPAPLGADGELLYEWKGEWGPG